MPEPRTLEEQQAATLGDHERRLRKLESLECPVDDDSGLIPWLGVRCIDLIPRLGDFGICNGQFEQGATVGYPISCMWIEESVGGAVARVVGGAAGDWCIELVPGTGTAVLRYDRYLCVFEDRDYYIACHANGVAGTEVLQIGAHCYDAAQAFIATVWAHNAAIPVGWDPIQRRIGPNGNVAWPANTRYCRPLMSSPSVGETLYVDDMQFQQFKMALNPWCAFSVVMSANMTNLAVNVEHTVEFDTEVFDVGGNFNIATYTFTAPVTGKYLLTSFGSLLNVDSAASFVQWNIRTSNRQYITIFPPLGLDQDVDNLGLSVSVIADMDQGDTAFVYVRAQGGAAQMDVTSAASYTRFMGCLWGS